MTHYNTNNTDVAVPTAMIENYIAKIGTFAEGERNNSLYKTGQHLRRRFGLHGISLLLWLQRINLTTCKPSLPDEEIDKIARSIDGSNTPIGSCSCSSDRYLSKEVSYFTKAECTSPSGSMTIREFLERCKNGTYQKQVDAIRTEPNKDIQNAMKLDLLPCVTIQAELCEQKTVKGCKNNSTICLDFDGVGDVKTAKTKIAVVPYVVAVGTSARGTGVFAVCALATPTTNLKTILNAMQSDFEYTLDQSCSNVNRLRYATYDPDLIVNDVVIPFRLEKPAEGSRHSSSGAIVLNPSRTQPSAKAFLLEKYHHAEGFTLKHYNGDFYCWTGRNYNQVPIELIKKEMQNWLTDALMYKKSDGLVPFPANDKTINSVVNALELECLLSSNIDIGAWLGNDLPPTANPIFVKNCVYDWRTGEQFIHDPRWFNVSCVDANIEGNTPTPHRWQRFLNDLWGDDQKSKALLLEFMGLCLIPDTSYQKMLFLIGLPRSGKGTIIRILTAILGAINVANPSADQLATEFGLQPLVGKLLAVLSDARFTGKEIQVAIERLLNITGEDRMMINRKHQTHLNTKLLTKILVAANAMPILPDNSGAVANRVLYLQLSNSFLGRED